MATPPSFQSPYPRPDLSPPSGPKCPQCGSTRARKIGYTWWGGVFVPRMMSLTKCEACGCMFHGNSGNPAQRSILLYNVIALMIAMGIMFVVFVLRS